MLDHLLKFVFFSNLARWAWNSSQTERGPLKGHVHWRRSGPMAILWIIYHYVSLWGLKEAESDLKLVIEVISSGWLKQTMKDRT